VRKCGAMGRGGTNTCCQDVISYNRAQKLTVAEMPIYQALCSAPGRTRTPNPLIRRSPNAVRRRPQPSIRPSTKGFQVHRRPYTTAAVHPGWLPTWLPAKALVSVVQQRRWLPRSHTWRGASGWGAQPARFGSVPPVSDSGGGHWDGRTNVSAQFMAIGARNH